MAINWGYPLLFGTTTARTRWCLMPRISSWGYQDTQLAQVPACRTRRTTRSDYIYIYTYTHTRAHNFQCITIMIGLIPMVVKFPTGTTNVAVACCEPAKSRLRLRHDIAGAPSRAAWAPSSAAAGAIAALRPGQWVTPATTGLTKVGFWLIYKLSNSKTAKVKT